MTSIDDSIDDNGTAGNDWQLLPAEAILCVVTHATFIDIHIKKIENYILNVNINSYISFFSMSSKQGKKKIT